MRLGIRSQISLLGLGLLAIPFIGYSYWQQVRDATLSTQAHIQTIEAKSIATSLLATQKDLSALLAADETSELYKYSLGAPFINRSIKLDGLLSDWPNKTLKSSLRQFSSTDHKDAKFNLQLAQTKEHLYLGLQVTDSQISFRQNHLRLDYNDHIRLTFLKPDGTLARIAIPAEREGALASYYSNFKWEYGIAPSADIKSHQTGIQGFWKRTQEGYNAEFRVPIDSFDTQNAQMHIAVVDVDDQPSLGPSTIISTLPASLSGKLNPIELHAQELQRVIEALTLDDSLSKPSNSNSSYSSPSYSNYAHLGIYDLKGREWAYSARRSNGLPSKKFDVDPECLEQALQGNDKPQAYQVENIDYSQPSGSRITICYPIIHQEKTIGVIVIDEFADHVLEQHRERLIDIAIKTGLTLASIVGLLFLYAIFLAKRVSRLSHATRSAVDAQGRIVDHTIKASKDAPDEIGDLSRDISALLVQQQSYIQFLERMPQTLRHEISNPLNKLRTSLENLLDEYPSFASNKNLVKIDKGIDQITLITQQLTEAADLESALQTEHLKRINLSQFVTDYCDHLNNLKVDINEHTLWINAEPSRLEQLLDKLMDNAFSFCLEDEPVRIQLERKNHLAILKIINKGPTVPQERMGELFSPMISTRSAGDSIHLGLGLHVAKIIATFHHASIRCENLDDQSGVCVSMTFQCV